MKTEVENNATTARTSRRSALTIMLRLVGLVRPLAGFMILAILMGVLGNLAATFISIFGAYALLSAMGFASSSPMVLLLEACLYLPWSAACCATLSRNAITLLRLSCLHLLETAYLRRSESLLQQSLRSRIKAT